jgi:hypothetical protein
LISFVPAAQQPLSTIFATGFLSGLNVGAGVAFVASGLSVAVLRQK